MTSLGALGALFFRGGLVRKVVTAYSGNSFPTYTPNPIFRAGLRVGRGRGRALVDPHPVAAAGGGRPGTAGGGDRVAGRLVHGRQRGLRRRRLPVRATRSAPAPGARRRAGARRRRRSGGQPRLLRAPPRRRVGRLGRSPWRRGDRRACRRRPRGPRAPGAGARPPCPGRGGGALRRPSGRLLRAGPAGPQLRRGHRALERRGRRRGQRRARRLRRASGCSVRPRTRTTWRASGSEQLLWLEGRSDPMSWKADADANPVVEDPDRHAVGAGGLASGPARSSGSWPTVGCRRRAGRRRRGQPRRLGRRGPGPGGRAQRHADRGARAVGVPADAGGPVHLQPAGLPGHAVPVGRLGGARHGDRRPGHDDGGLPRRGRGRPRRELELHPAGRWALPGRVGRGQRRGQPGHRMRRRHPGPARAAARRPSPT